MFAFHRWVPAEERAFRRAPAVEKAPEKFGNRGRPLGARGGRARDCRGEPLAWNQPLAPASDTSRKLRGLTVGDRNDTPIDKP